MELKLKFKKEIDMQQELIEMLEEIIQYVEVWRAQDQEVIDKAEALIKKAKNNAPSVLQEVVLTDDVIADAEKWRALKASNPQLGMSWLGNPFVGFYMGRPANKAWADAINEGLDIDAAIIAALRAKGNKL